MRVIVFKSLTPILQSLIHKLVILGVKGHGMAEGRCLGMGGVLARGGLEGVRVSGGFRGRFDYDFRVGASGFVAVCG